MPVEDTTGEVAPLVAWGLNQRKAAKLRSWLLSVESDQEKTDISDRLSINVGKQTTFGTTNLRDGNWHHVAAVAIGGDHGTTILLYVDGELEKVKRKKHAIKTITNNEKSEPVQFGRHPYVPNLLLRGSLDEVYLFGAALTGDEIRQLMHDHQP